MLTAADNTPDIDFDAFIQQGWSDHAGDPASVAVRLQSQGQPAASGPAQVAALARLAHHVHGEHLARWAEGLAFQHQLAALPACTDTAADALRRFIASLSLAGGQADLRTTLGPSDAVWVTALAAASLVPHDVARAGLLMQEALARFEAAALPADDPCTRALAVSANNIASGLEELPTRNAAQRDLMIQAAQAARHFWALAGGWLETERAEYRLANSWLKAGDARQARVHAEQCLAIVDEHGGVLLERFFAFEVMALTARALGDESGLGQALAAMRTAFGTLSADDQAGCRETLDKLASVKQ